MSSYSRQQLEAHLKTIEVDKVRVLDVGGAQGTIKGRTKTWNAIEYETLDLLNPHEESPRPDIIWNLNNDLPYRNIKRTEPFDVAFCIEVSEYWYNPLQALKNIAGLLKRGGILYISFHFVYPVHNPEEEDYLRYTQAGARKLLKEAGFTTEEMEVRKFMYAGFFKEAYSKEGMRGVNRNTGNAHEQQGFIFKCIKR